MGQTEQQADAEISTAKELSKLAISSWWLMHSCTRLAAGSASEPAQALSSVQPVFELYIVHCATWQGLGRDGWSTGTEWHRILEEVAPRDCGGFPQQLLSCGFPAPCDFRLNFRGAIRLEWQPLCPPPSCWTQSSNWASRQIVWYWPAIREKLSNRGPDPIALSI